MVVDISWSLLAVLVFGLLACGGDHYRAFHFLRPPALASKPELRRSCFATPRLVRKVRFAPLHAGHKKCPLSGALLILFAERAGNEPSRQYVGYQMFDLPAYADSMNWTVAKERVRFILANLRIAGPNVAFFSIIPGLDPVDFFGESGLILVWIGKNLKVNLYK